MILGKFVEKDIVNYKYWDRQYRLSFLIDTKEKVR